MPRRLLAALTLLTLAPLARADDWPQWLGPRRDGVWREEGILDKLPAGGKLKELWRVKVGPGYAGPVVVGDRVYLMDRIPEGKEKPFPPRGGKGKERVLCLSAKDGKILWKHEYDCPYIKMGYPSGPRVTPVVAGGRVYALGAAGHLFCLDADSGKPVWSKNLVKDYNAPQPVWGWAGHPLLVGDKLFVIAGGPGSAAVALDAKTGKDLWKALDTQEIGYVPPTLLEAGGKKQLLIWLSGSLNGLDPDSGKTYWSIPYPEDGMPDRPSVNIATPVKLGDTLLISEFYRGTLAVKLDAKKPAADVLWRSKSKGPTKTHDIHVLMMTPAVKDGHYYATCAMGELRCVEAATGKRVWETLKPFGGEKALFGTIFIVEQGGRFWLFTDQGDLILANLTPKGYEELGRANLLRPTQDARGRTVVWSHPAFANRCIFARNDEELVCVPLAK